MRLNNKSLLGALILGILLIGQTQSTSANFSTTITITDGTYGNLDFAVNQSDDGFEDDIILNMTLEISNKKYQTSVDLYFGITLPSGTEYWFLAEFIIYKTTDYASFNIAFIILNIATEAGWYTANAVGFAANEQFSYMDTLIFDPPGGETGTRPFAYSIIY